MSNVNKLSDFGYAFQIKLIAILFKDRLFLQQIIDILDYSLPFGLIGLFFHPFLVKPKLDEIFKYREKKLIEIFGKL